MSGYVGWVALAALVASIAALAVALAERFRRQRNGAAARSMYEGLQSMHAAQWDADLREAVYQPPHIVASADQCPRQ